MSEQPAVALSLREPWLWAILHLGKDVENRTWRRGFTGRVILHAARRWDEEGARWLTDHGYQYPTRHCFELAGALGAFVGEVTITGCYRPGALSGNPWAFGPWCYTLKDAVPYDDPIPGAGMLGFFRPTHALAVTPALIETGRQGKLFE